MEKINSMDQLSEAIGILKNRQAVEGVLLKEQFFTTFNSLKPFNLIKNSFKDALSSPDFKDNLLGTTVGLATGFISKTILIGATHNPIKNIVGNIIQLGISSVVSKNPETVKLIATTLLGFFKKKKETLPETNFTTQV